MSSGEPCSSDVTCSRLPSSHAAMVLAGLVAVIGCSDATGPRSDILTVDRTLDGLMLRNRIGEPVYWYAAERESLAYTEYVFCTGAACSSIVPHASERLDYDGILGYHRGAREAVVFHFRLVPAAGGGVRADSIRGLVVRL
jgi:hypothetical protein